MSNFSLASALPRAERVHRIFRGSTELVKWLRQVALFTEVIAALIAGWRIFVPDLSWSGWASFCLALILLSGVALRIWAKSISSFAERCRRVAIRAYALGVDISTAVSISLIGDAPVLSERLSSKLPTQSLDDYYEGAAPEGVQRTRELYAHSAFYSWRLLRACWRSYLVGTLLFAAIGFFIIYLLAADTHDPTVRGRILDLVCSVVFVFLTAKAAVVTVDAKQSADECRRVFEGLVSQSAADSPNDLAIDYDIERASGIKIPTFLYKISRDSLQKEWHDIRSGLN